MTMGTDSDNAGKNGPKFSIEFPPPIPDKGKAKGQKPPGRSQKKKTERINLPPPVGQKAAPLPIPVRGEKQPAGQRPPVRSERTKTQKLSEPQSAGPKAAPQPIPVRGEDNATGQNSSSRRRGRTVRILPPSIDGETQPPPLPGEEAEDSPTPQKPSSKAVIGALFVVGFVAFMIFIVVQASKGPNSSSVAYSPAGSTVQDTPAPTPEAATPTPANTFDPAREVRRAIPVLPSPADNADASPTVSSTPPNATGDAKPEENDSLAQTKFQEAFEAGKQRKYADSIAAYREALQAKPSFPEAWSNIGWDYAQTGDMPNSISAYKQAVQIKPDLADAWNGLASCYATNQDAENADLALQNLDRLDSGRAKQFLCALPKDFLLKIAVARYPSLGVLDTPLNSEYRRRHDYYKANLPSYLESVDWPVSLAKEVYDSMDPAQRGSTSIGNASPAPSGATP